MSSGSAPCTWAVAVGLLALGPLDEERFELHDLRVETVLDNGGSRGRVDVVVIGDGYVAEDLEDDGAFDRDVDRLLRRFFRFEPFRSYRSRFNVHAVYAESLDRGAEDRPGEDEHRTILDTTFDKDGGRLLVFQDVLNLQRIARRAPDVDIVLVLVNDPRYGGSGQVVWDRIPAPVCSSTEEGLNIAIHELAHSFAGLGDEYVDHEAAERYPLPAGTADLSAPNLTLASHVDTTSARTIAKTVKWRHFLELDGASDRVSAFEGGYYRATGVFRPEADCMMRTKGRPFCLVCQEALARRIHEVAGRRFSDRKYHAAMARASGDR